MGKSLFTLVAVILLAAVSFCAQAKSVSLAQAQAAAQRFVESNSRHFNAQSGNTLRLAYEAKSVDGMTDYFVFNRGDNGGFVVVAGDDRLHSIAGYSDNGAFDADALPCNVQWWFSEYQRQMQFLRENPGVKAREVVELDSVVAPLLTTQWNQCRPYNDMCPVAPAYDDVFLYYGGHACTGCVATAMAQVMKYWEWPKRGMGSHSYNCEVSYYDSEMGEYLSRTDVLSADFSQSVYQWNLMKDEYFFGLDENDIITILVKDDGKYFLDSDGLYGNAVAKLMSDVGISVDMGYGSNGSGADSYGVYKALYYYFGYLVDYASRDVMPGDDFGDAAWDISLRWKLAQGIPIYYSGSGQNGGHAFVLDGYDNEGRFHVNWGWGGSFDGYFETLSLNPANYQFNTFQAMVTGEPYRPLTSLPENGKTLDFGIVPMDSAVFKTVMLYGTYLDDRLVVDISGKDAIHFQTEVYSIPSTEVNDEEGYALEIVYFPATQGSHTAQLTLTPQGNDIHGNPIEPIRLTLKGRLGDVCDVNLDGEVNIADVNMETSLILSGVSDSIVGDVNLDGEINIADINAIIDVILSN